LLLDADVLDPLVWDGARAAAQYALLDADVVRTRDRGQPVPAQPGHAQARAEHRKQDRHKGEDTGGDHPAAVKPGRDRQGGLAEAGDRLYEKALRIGASRRLFARLKRGRFAVAHSASRRILARIVSRMASASPSARPGS